MRRGASDSVQLLLEQTGVCLDFESSLDGSGQDFHFFLSHKKHHSTYGMMHAQIAQQLSDSLEQLNFHGFLDIDCLDEISESALRNAIEESSTMIVLLNDETHLSTWCLNEWRIAAELKIPIKVIIDLEHANLEVELARAKKSYPYLLSYQWIEYTNKRRREAVQELALFLVKHFITCSDSSFRMQTPSNPTDDPIPIVDPITSKLVLLSGISIGSAPSSSSRQVWAMVVRSFTYLCLLLCLMRYMYASGPAYTDSVSVLATVVLHVHLIVAPRCSVKAMNSPLIQQILAGTRVKGGTAAELALKVNSISRVLSRLTHVVTPFVILMYVVSWQPLFLSAPYLTEGSTLDYYFGMGSAAVFFLGTLTLIPLLLCVHYLSALVKLMSTITCESSADLLHPQIASLGLRHTIELRWQIIETRMKQGCSLVKSSSDKQGSVAAQDCESKIPPLRLTDQGRLAFQENWKLGYYYYESLHANLFPLQNVLLLWASVCLILPLSLAIRSSQDESFTINRFNESQRYLFWCNMMRLVWIWIQGPLLLLFDLYFDVLCTRKMDDAARLTALLSFAEPIDSLII